MLMRQGDLFFQKVDVIPPAAEKVRHRVLAEGEITGHSHRIAESGVATVYKLDDEFYVDVPRHSANVIHEEHGTVALDQGRYRVWRQREYTPTAIVRVVD